MFAEHLVLHSLGLCVAFVVALPVLWLARKDPVIGHRLLLLLLVTGLCLPALTLPLAGKAAATGDRVLARIAVETAPSTSQPSTPSSDATDPRGAPSASSVSKPRNAPTTARGAHEATDSTPTPPAGLRPPAHSPPTSDTPRSNAVVAPASRTDSRAEPDAGVAATPRAVGSSMRQRARDAAVGANAALRRAAPYVAVVWLLGVLLVGRRHVRRLSCTARLVRDATAVTDDATLAVWRTAVGDHPLAQRITLRRSEAVDAPACWGVHRPVILLPTAEPTAHDALAFALRHELVHLERRDPLAAIAQAVLKTLYWFHPVAWWLSAQIDRTRELACDQLVAASTSQRKRYALALLDHARAALPAGAGVTAVTRSPTLLHWAPTLPQLRRRIEMLLTKNAPLSLRRRWLVLGGAATAVVLLLAAQGTVAATMLSDAPLAERLVACCPPKPQNAPNSRPAVTPTAPNPAKPSKARRAAKPPRDAQPSTSSSSIAANGSDPFDSVLSFTTGDGPFVLGTGSATSVAAVAATDSDPLRDALIHVLTETNDQDARVTAAQALGTQLHDAAVRRAFARVLRDEWEGSDVRDAVGDALLQSDRFSPEAHEIIAALLKRDGAEDTDVFAGIDTFPTEAGLDDEESAELAAMRERLASEFGVDSVELDEDVLEEIQDLEAEFGDMDDLTIDVGDALDTLELGADAECDESCDESCEESCEDSCDESSDEASEETTDEESEAEEAANERREAVAELLQSLRAERGADSTQRLMDELLAKRAAGDQQVRVKDLLRALLGDGPHATAPTLAPASPDTSGADSLRSFPIDRIAATQDT